MAINSNPGQTSTGGPSQLSRPNQPETVSYRFSLVPPGFRPDRNETDTDKGRMMCGAAQARAGGRTEDLAHPAGAVTSLKLHAGLGAVPQLYPHVRVRRTSTLP